MRLALSFTLPALAVMGGLAVAGNPQAPSPAATLNSAYTAPAGGALLVVTKQAHALAIVDGKTLLVLAHIPIGQDPHEVVVGPDGHTAYVSNFGEGTLHTLARVDLMAAQQLPPVELRPLAGPHGLAVHGDRLWFTAVGSEALGELDPSTNQVAEVLGTGQQNTHMLWISRDGARIVASNAGSGTMSIFDRVTVSPNVVPGAPQPPASYTHTEWRQTILPVGARAEGFAVSPDEHKVWVGNDDGTISVLDLVAKTAAVRFPAGTTGANRLRWTPDGARVLVTTHTGKDLVVLDADKQEVIKRIHIEERGASAIQLDPEGRRAFIACPRDHFVAVVDLVSLKRVATIDVGREPDGMTWWTR